MVHATGRAVQNPPVPVQGGSPAVQTGGAIGNTGATLPLVPSFHTPAGHYHNPADNLYAATVALDRILLGDSPAAIETRHAIEMLRTAMAQQAQYPHRKSALHSTTYRSHPRSHHGESPRPAGAPVGEPQALAGQQVPHQPRQAAPAVSRAQAIVDSSRARRAANRQPAVVPVERIEEIPRAGSVSNHQAPRPVHATPTSSMAGPRCLADSIRAEPYPDKFKEPSKISNYDPSMDPETWINSYEMAMSIRNASENICAKFMYLMMSEGAAKLWFNAIPENTITSWSQLRTAFTKNFHGTCKKLYTLDDLDRCVHRKGESGRH